MAAETKIHELKVTKGALLILKQIIPTPNWYEGQRASVPVRAEEFLESDGVADLKVPPDTEPEKQDAWAKDEATVTVSEKVRDALKICVGFYLKKAQLRPSKHVSRLIRELGLNDE